MNATELLKYAESGKLLNGKRFVYKDISIGTVVRRKNNHKVIYFVETFFNEEKDGGLMIGGHPPTVWDKIDDIEKCPVENIPQWMFGTLSEKILRLAVYRANDIARHEKLLEALRLFIKVKELKDDMNDCIDKREDGMVGIMIRNDELAKKYQRIYEERENLKSGVYTAIDNALKEASEI